MTKINDYAERARHLLLENRSDSRAFDNCFENFCGDQVIYRLIKLSETDDELFQAIRDQGFWERWQEVAAAQDSKFFTISSPSALENPFMTSLLTQEQIGQLLKNGADMERGKDHLPVVKLFIPGTGCTWILTELDPENPSIAFGLCDLGMGFPELGDVSLEELEHARAIISLVQPDEQFQPLYRLSVYAQAARNNQCITEDGAELMKANVQLQLREYNKPATPFPG